MSNRDEVNELSTVTKPSINNFNIMDNFIQYVRSNNMDLDDVVKLIENTKNKEKCCEARSMTEEQAEKIKIHKKLCEDIHRLYETKNMDYGDSMHPLFEKYGIEAFLILFNIKINRIESLQHNSVVHYESMEDSLMDLANYALIAITELKSKNSHN